MPPAPADLSDDQLLDRWMNRIHDHRHTAIAANSLVRANHVHVGNHLLDMIMRSAQLNPPQHIGLPWAHGAIGVLGIAVIPDDTLSPDGWELRDTDPAFTVIAAGTLDDIRSLM